MPSGDTFPLLEDLGVIGEFDLARDLDFSCAEGGFNSLEGGIQICGGSGLNELGLATGGGGEIEKLDMEGFDGFCNGDGLERLTQRDKELGCGRFGFDEGAVDLAPVSRLKD